MDDASNLPFSEIELNKDERKICVGIIYPYRLIVRARRKRHSSA